jgi:hypothetical protein
MIQSPGSAFGAASTLVAQLGILLGMLVSRQGILPLTVAAASSAVSGSFGDAFSMYVSETTAGREALSAASDVLFSKLTIGAIFILFYLLIGNHPTLLLLFSICFSLLLLGFLSNTIAKAEEEKYGKSSLLIFLQFTALTVAVVATTTSIGYILKKMNGHLG